MKTGIRSWMAIAAVAVLPACGEGGNADSVAQDTAPAQEVPAAAAPAMDDAAIAHVAVTANAIDIEMGELALERSRTESVRAFAETMIRDHSGVNEQATELAGRLGVTPTDNDVSRSLQSDAEAVRGQLEALSGAEFDRAYMEREVAYHQAVLDALDTTLIPGTSNAELRALLEGARGAVAAHLDHARQLSGELGSAGGQ